MFLYPVAGKCVALRPGKTGQQAKPQESERFKNNLDHGFYRNSGAGDGQDSPNDTEGIYACEKPLLNHCYFMSSHVAARHTCKVWDLDFKRYGRDSVRSQSLVR